MNCRIFDYPTRIVVSSESETDVEYVVDLCRFPVGLDQNGNMVFNGSCGRSDLGVKGCRNFIYKCEPMLKKPENMGKIYRCKHIREAREHALDFILPKMCEMDPNKPEEFQT